jgi:glucosamine-6-phosphate deaminase
MPPALHRSRVDRLDILVYADRQALGLAAASEVARALIESIEQRGSARAYFASAPSQWEMVDALVATPGIDWSKVSAVQIDEYLGLGPAEPRSLGAQLAAHLFEVVQPGAVVRMDGAADPEAERARCAKAIGGSSFDVGCLGIGENGHIAFNDPGVADFQDPLPCKVVELDPTSRAQQVHDRIFDHEADVPTHALTLTIPVLMAAARIVCVVPGIAKRAAVEAVLSGPIDPQMPGSILRTHANTTLFLDSASWPWPLALA